MLENLTLLPKAWYLGNTTVRSPYRIKEALGVLSQSALLGRLLGRDNENEFARLLHTSEVVTISRLVDNPNADVSDLGRKWRAALVQLGFLTPDQDTLNSTGITTSPYILTPNGRRLISGDSLQAEQECFLRALLAQQIPSPIEHFQRGLAPFNPLRIVLSIISCLESSGLEPVIRINEMASIVQLIGDINSIQQVVEVIRTYRNEEEPYRGRDRNRFQNQVREEAASRLQSQNAATLGDYADTNFRYLKLTGLFSERGHGICFSAHKRTLIRQILASPFDILPDAQYLENIWQGARIPSDNPSDAVDEIMELADLLTAHGEVVPLPLLDDLAIQDLSQIRIDLEERWRRIQEINFANDQAAQWQDIVRYLREFGNRNSRLIPRGEAPAYLEWILWRAFLAIDSLSNQPWEARRFRIDQDFLPISTAAGNGPDMIFEFEDFAIVVEVTLTTSSRQEAAEGEPVRRHVADYVDHYESLGKTVYGLFIANTINTNTAETFRIGVWYRNDDSRLAVWIVPITIEQFANLFEAGFTHSDRLESDVISQLLLRCRAESNVEAPEWKRIIDRHVNRTIRDLQ